jgi:glutamate-1-semialdehyde aminotransferase
MSYPSLDQLSRELMKGIQERTLAAKIPLNTVACGGLFGIFFTHEPGHTSPRHPAIKSRYDGNSHFRALPTHFNLQYLFILIQ